jgi:ribonuclease HI
MNKDIIVNKAFSSPSLRQNLMNSGRLFLYCDYAGFASRNVYGVACCSVHNRKVTLSTKKLMIERDRGSNYGEMMAIVFSLESLLAALVEVQPKNAIIYTDCSRISRILVQNHFSYPHDEHARDELLATLAILNRQFPNVDVQIKYMSKHKENNDFHRLAHHASRKAALHSV